MDTPDSPEHAPGERELPVQERPGVPRWVKVFALIGLAVVVILVVLMLLGIEHGPGLHSSAVPRGLTVSATAVSTA